jgi:hypothetical protein
MEAFAMRDTKFFIGFLLAAFFAASVAANLRPQTAEPPTTGSIDSRLVKLEIVAANTTDETVK